MTHSKKAKNISKSHLKSTHKKEIANDLGPLENLLKLIKNYQVIEFDWHYQGHPVKIKTNGFLSSALPPSVSMPLQMGSDLSREATGLSFATHGHSFNPEEKMMIAQKRAASTTEGSTISAQLKPVTSPFVGTFYRSASPESSSYVQEGQIIKRGDVLCIIEAMKLMNEIEAEFSGKIISILVENGQPVEFGEPLFMIES